VSADGCVVPFPDNGIVSEEFTAAADNRERTCHSPRIVVQKLTDTVTDFAGASVTFDPPSH